MLRGLVVERVRFVIHVVLVGVSRIVCYLYMSITFYRSNCDNRCTNMVHMPESLLPCHLSVLMLALS